MGIRVKFDGNQVASYIKSRIDKVEAAILNRLKYLGEQLVNHAREYGSYIDQTGNLRNSIGYIICKDGKVVFENYEAVVRRRGGDQGKQKAKEYANRLRLEFPKGYVLIVVAGMNYAAKVESRGRNVLSSAEQLCKTEMPRMISELKLNINQMK